MRRWRPVAVIVIESGPPPWRKPLVTNSVATRLASGSIAVRSHSISTLRTNERAIDALEELGGRGVVRRLPVSLATSPPHTARGVPGRLVLRFPVDGSSCIATLFVLNLLVSVPARPSL